MCIFMSNSRKIRTMNLSVLSQCLTILLIIWYYFAASGYLGCVYSIQDTTTPTIYYVGVYNFDTSVNGASTTRFTCFVSRHNS